MRCYFVLVVKREGERGGGREGGRKVREGRPHDLWIHPPTHHTLDRYVNVCAPFQSWSYVLSSFTSLVYIPLAVLSLYCIYYTLINGGL